MLYPLKFEPIYKKRIWGGSKLRDTYNRMCADGVPIGESWELSGLEGDVSVVANGILAGNDIQELIEVYMGELIGDRIYNRYGEEFPIIVKLLDAKDILSVQVHPDNELALKRHNAYGKSEMWYVMECEEDAVINLGFNKTITQNQYIDSFKNGEIASLLKEERPKKGSIYYIPSGTIHAIGKGVMIAEIQQTSDITYRVFDWNRVDEDGNCRELHTELAIDALNFNAAKGLEITKNFEPNKPTEAISSDDFVVNLLEVDGFVERDYSDIDSFVIYMCLDGDVIVECEGGSEGLINAETILLPAVFESARLNGKGKLLEIYMPK